MPTKGKCKECGAGLKLGPAPCPLCGADPNEARTRTEDTRWGDVVVDVDDYQANVRALRKRLRKLREEARGA